LIEVASRRLKIAIMRYIIAIIRFINNRCFSTSALHKGYEMISETEIEQPFDQKETLAAGSSAARKPRAECEIWLIQLGIDAPPIKNLWLVSCRDKFSGIGASILTKGFPDKAAVQRCLQSAIAKFNESPLRTRKADAVTLVCDQGQEFCSREFTEACSILGFQIEYLPPRPHFKSHVESLLADLDLPLKCPTAFTNGTDVAKTADRLSYP
jgi:hypothetical protein